MNNYIYCLKMFVTCLVPVLAGLILIKYMTGLSGEPFRKLLHTVAYLCPVSIMHFSDSWLTASVTLTVIGIIVYPLLVLAEKHPVYAGFFHQRHNGEVKLSMLQLFLGCAVIVALCWGVFDMKYIAGCAILMWGPGDAAAALLGKRFGRHKINLPLADKKKSWEGSLSFMAISFVIGVIWLGIFSEMSLLAILVTALATSALGAYVELITKGGFDTITVPFSNMVILIIMSFIMK